MNRFVKIGLLMGLAVVVFGAYRYVSAQEGQALGRGTNFKDPAPTFRVDIPAIVSPHHVLQGTYITSGLYDRTVAANTFTPIDTQLTVVCPGVAGSVACSISADMWVQNGSGTASANWNRVCLYVDGNPGPFCNYLADETLSDGEYENSTSSDIVSSIAPGNHTVQTYFYSLDGAYVAHYHSNYHVYKP